MTAEKQPAITSEIVARPMFSTTPFPPACHAATLVETRYGLLAVWYAGSFEGAQDTVLCWSRSNDYVSWSTPALLLDLPGIPVGNPVLFKKDDVIWLFFVILYGDWWTESRIAAMTSRDDGETWGSPRLLRNEMGLMTKTTPLISGNHFILPIYNERTWCSMVLLSRDGGESWEMFGDTMGRGITIQPKIVELSDGRLLMFSRSSKGKIYYSYSYNQGLSWTATQPTDLPNPNSGLDMIVSTAGNLVLACNDTERGRERLSLLLSQDSGRTWPHRRALEDAQGEFSYPAMCQDRGGRIHVVHTSQRQVLCHSVVTDEWIIDGD